MLSRQSVQSEHITSCSPVRPYNLSPSLLALPSVRIIGVLIVIQIAHLVLLRELTFSVVHVDMINQWLRVLNVVSYIIIIIIRAIVPTSSKFSANYRYFPCAAGVSPATWCTQSLTLKTLAARLTQTVNSFDTFSQPLLSVCSTRQCLSSVFSTFGVSAPLVAVSPLPNGVALLI